MKEQAKALIIARGGEQYAGAYAARGAGVGLQQGRLPSPEDRLSGSRLSGCDVAASDEESQLYRFTLHPEGYTELEVRFSQAYDTEEPPEWDHERREGWERLRQSVARLSQRVTQPWRFGTAVDEWRDNAWRCACLPPRRPPPAR